MRRDSAIDDHSRRAERPLAIASPADGTLYLIDPTLRPEFQRLSLRATAGDDAQYIEWSIDGQQIGRSAPERALAWSLVAGEHLITARDARGRLAETRIRVR